MISGIEHPPDFHQSSYFVARHLNMGGPMVMVNLTFRAFVAASPWRNLPIVRLQKQTYERHGMSALKQPQSFPVTDMSAKLPDGYKSDAIATKRGMLRRPSHRYDWEPNPQLRAINPIAFARIRPAIIAPAPY